MGRKSYLGNIKWTSGSILQILRNERHCGDVLTRKTYTPNYRDHLAKKNRGQRPQSKYFDHHEAIVSRGDFIAVQRMLDNAKYGNRSILPKLRVIDGGKLKGFVIINPRWAGFGVQEYYLAAQSVRAEREDAAPQIQVKAGDFDFRGFEITRSEFLNPYRRPQVTFEEKRIRFSAECVQRFGAHNHVELLIDPINQRFALRSADEKNRNAVLLSKPSAKGFCPKSIPAAAFYGTLFNLFGWNVDYKYRIIGSLYEKDGEVVYIFDTKNSEAFLKSYVLAKEETISGGTTVLQPLAPLGKRIRAIPEAWAASFGKQFYRHELDLETLESQSKEDWKLRLEGRIFETGEKIRVTEFEELRSYIRKELSAVMSLEGPHE